MSKRLTYQTDGSTFWKVVTNFASGNQTALTSGQTAILNGDASQVGQYVELITSSNVFSGLLFKFPSAIKIRKIFLAFFWATRGGAATSTLLIEASDDSTDGEDGTWVTLYSAAETVEAADSSHRLFLKTQTEDEENQQTYTWIRMSWSGNGNLNNLRINSAWIYGEYDSPPYDLYDGQSLTKIQVGEMVLGLFASNATVDKSFKFIIKNNESSGAANRTYTITFTKVKVTADATFAEHITLSTDNETTATSIQLTVAAGEQAEFFLHVDIPKAGDVNANPADGEVHYGKLAITESNLTTLPGLVFALFYDTLANVEQKAGIGLVDICLVFQRDIAIETLGAWSWWDTTGVASAVQQEDVGNDIVLLLDSSGFLWEMDRGELDNEEFTPTPIQMVAKSLELPADADPHILRRNVYFDFDVDKADGGMLGEYRLTAHKQTGKTVTTQDIEIANPAMRLSKIANGFQFNHEIRVFGGGALAIKNWACSYQNLSTRGRKPYIAA